MARRVPSYRHHKPSGSAVVTINCRDYYLGKHGTKASKTEYKRLISQYKSSNYSTSFGLDSEHITIAMVAVLLLAMVLCGWSGLAAASLALLICAAFCRFTASRIGGYTGDTLGATQQFAEVASLIILLALLS